MAYTYADVLAGLQVRFQTMAGIEDVSILNYEPKAPQAFPTLYTLLEDVQWVNLTLTTRLPLYRMLHRMLFLWQENEQAEVELAGFVDALPAAVEADPHLGGVLTDGARAQVDSCEATFIRFGGSNTLYRALDFHSTAGPIGGAAE
jgi:hypothetical protein